MEESIKQHCNKVQDPSAYSSPPAASQPCSQASPEMDPEELFRQFGFRQANTNKSVVEQFLFNMESGDFSTKAQKPNVFGQSKVASSFTDWMKSKPATSSTVKPHQTQPVQSPAQSSVPPPQTQPVRPPPEPYVPPPPPPKTKVAPPPKAKIPSPLKNQPESSGTTPQGASTGVKTATTSIQNAESLEDLLNLPGREMDDFTSVFKIPRVRRRMKRQFAVAS
jgi:hypothetical protein